MANPDNSINSTPDLTSRLASASIDTASPIEGTAATPAASPSLVDRLETPMEPAESPMAPSAEDQEKKSKEDKIERALSLSDIQEWAEKQLEAINKKFTPKEAPLVSEAKRKEGVVRKNQLIERLSQALVQIGAGIAGLRTGANLGELKFIQTDFERQLDRISRETESGLSRLDKARSEELKFVQSAQDKLADILSRRGKEATTFKSDLTLPDGTPVFQKGDQFINAATNEPVPPDQLKKIQSRGEKMFTAGEERRKTQYVSGLVKDFKNDAVVKKSSEMIASAALVMNVSIDALDNPIAANAIPTFAARASGEVGNLSEADKAPFGTSKQITDRLAQIKSTYLEKGTITEDNFNYIMQLSKVMQKTAVSNIKDRAKKMSTSFASPLAPKEDLLMRFNAYADEPREALIAPDGGVLSVPSSEVDRLIKAGARRQ